MVSGILVALMRHTLLLGRRQMPLVVRMRKLALLTVVGCISDGGTTGAKLPCRVRLTVRPISVSLSSVFRLARQQNSELDIPVLCVMLTVVRVLLTLRRLCMGMFLVLKLWTCFCPLIIWKLHLLLTGVLRLIRPDSMVIVVRRVVLALWILVLVIPIRVVRLPACVSSVGCLLGVVRVIR